MDLCLLQNLEAFVLCKVPVVSSVGFQELPGIFRLQGGSNKLVDVGRRFKHWIEDEQAACTAFSSFKANDGQRMPYLSLKWLRLFVPRPGEHNVPGC